MKVKLTESQYLKMIVENVNPNEERILNHFFDRVSRLNPKEAMDVYFDEYGFDDRIMRHSKRLYDWFKYGIIHRLGLSSGRYQIIGFNKKILSLFDIWVEDAIDNILNSNVNEYQKVNSLSTIENILPFSYNDRKLSEVIDGLLFDAVEHLFQNNEPKEAIKKSSILKDKIGYWRFKSFTPIVKDFAEKSGLTIIPKHKGYTFERGEETMIRDLIKYMKDIPELPKKTKRGFLNYIGSRSQGRGQYSTFWSAVNKAGIIQKMGGGNNVSYELGPNYKSWEEGNVVAF